MQNKHDNGTTYTFQESGAGNLLLETADMFVISEMVPSHTIAGTVKVIIKGISYIVVGFEIHTSGANSVINTTHPQAQIDPTQPYGTRTPIYLKQTIRPLRNFF